MSSCSYNSMHCWWIVSGESGPRLGQSRANHGANRPAIDSSGRSLCDLHPCMNLCWLWLIQLEDMKQNNAQKPLLHYQHMIILLMVLDIGKNITYIVTRPKIEVAQETRRVKRGDESERASKILLPSFYKVFHLRTPIAPRCCLDTRRSEQAVRAESCM